MSIPLSLYVHIPWCVRKCPYCDFNSHAVRDELPEATYIDTVLADLRHEARWAQGREIQSIFIGGGTPSLFSAQSIAKLLDSANRIVPFASDIEITMEANPGTFEQDKFAGFLAAGVNRLSIGVQSFNTHHLKALGRIHSGQEAERAIAAAHQLGFKRLNIDLMHGLPDQTPQQALADLEQGLALGPDHLSWYQLTIEPNTEFYQRPPQIPEDDALWEIQQQGQARIHAAGFTQYEVSAYAKAPTARARHNLNYWEFGDYIGIGAGAHGKVTDLSTHEIHRRWKQRSPKAYMTHIDPLGGSRILAPDELPFEFMMNALRLIDGVPTERFHERTGQPIEVMAAVLQQAREKGLLHPHRLQATPQGQLFLNDLLGLFLDE
ncbi:radical SAM family heme chaperone HemW [Neptunomonas marina]|uniref:Heme chaperone HemW n=1 Tax=Neptunomonas marina TaxID=1815562 RepID=A0A437QAL2_9GAMM|nr:radical SAM family heme chaperone HemW [Neptunomonas marina]RVU31537.1 radical SAM family heme chaperone HemW [Neptunomonas marina]